MFYYLEITLFIIFKIFSISWVEGSSAAVSLVGTSIPVVSNTFSLPLVSVLGLSMVMQTGVVVVVGGEMLGEKILLVLVTLLEASIFVTSSVFSLLI